MKSRILTQEDISAYQTLRLQALKEFPTSFGSSYELEKNSTSLEIKEKLQQNENRFTIGTFLNGKLVGILTFKRETAIKTNHKGSIFGVYVDSRFQKKGIGKKILADTISYLKTIEGLEQINLTVNSTNRAAIRLYTEFGFENFGYEKNALKFKNEYFDEGWMVLKLK